MITEMRKLEAENRALKTRIGVLEGQVEALEEALRQERYGAQEWQAPRAWRLTPKEAELTRALLSRGRCTKEYLLEAIYGTGEDPPVIKIIDVFICKLRAKLARQNIRIETVWGVGYELTPAARAALLAADEGAGRAAAATCSAAGEEAAEGSPDCEEAA